MPITVSYIPDSAAWPPVSDCSDRDRRTSRCPPNADGLVARCLKVDGVEIPKHHAAHIHVAYEFRWKNTAELGQLVRSIRRCSSGPASTSARRP